MDWQPRRLCVGDWLALLLCMFFFFFLVICVYRNSCLHCWSSHPTTVCVEPRIYAQKRNIQGRCKCTGLTASGFCECLISMFPQLQRTAFMPVFFSFSFSFRTDCSLSFAQSAAYRLYTDNVLFMKRGWIKKGNCLLLFLFFLTILLRVTLMAFLVCIYVRGRVCVCVCGCVCVWAILAGAAVYRRQLTPEVCCSPGRDNLIHPETAPGTKEVQLGRLPRHVPSTVVGPPKKRGRPSLDVAVMLDGSTAPHGCSSSTTQSAPQLALELVGDACSPGACQKKVPGATEEVQISSNGLDPDGCAHDNRPPCLWFGGFVTEERRGPTQ